MGINRCPACGAGIQIKIATGINIICTYCGSSFSCSPKSQRINKEDDSNLSSVCGCGNAIYSTCSICSIALCEKCLVRPVHFDIQSIITSYFVNLSSHQIIFLQDQCYKTIHPDSPFCTSCFDDSLTDWLSSLPLDRRR